MLPSFVANLLWGPSTQEDEPGEVAEHYCSEEAEDWLLVTNHRAASGSPSTGHGSRLNSDYDDCDAQSVLSDGSWVITPAVTFGGTEPCEAADPLEDLLIEHPTMSVYHSACSHDIAGQPSNEIDPSAAQVNSNAENHIRELVQIRNRHRHELATQLQIPLTAGGVGVSKKPLDRNTPPRLTRRALKRHNANKVKPSKIQKCSFKAGKRRS